MSVVAGRPQNEWTMAPLHFGEMRRAAWDVHARVKDMDIDGV